MRIRLSQLVVIILCFLVVVFFWHIKDTKRHVLKEGKLSSISALKESEISSEAINLQEAFVKVAERIKPAVVNISTVLTIEYPQYEFFFGDPFEDFFKDFEEFFGRPYKREIPKRKYRQQLGGGSGVIIHPDGYILTNEHVIHNADEIKVTINIDGKEKTYKGKVVGKDIRTDLAVIKIEPSEKLPSAPLGDSDKIRVGEWVIAIGSPFGLEQTVTSGIVSALRQSIQVEGRVYRDFIQTDAAINRGNSGGPLCNIRGEVIGINTAIYAPTGVFSGIGFAIPINRAKEILDDLIHRGKVVRGWLGVEIKPVDTAIKNQFGLKDEKGVLINNVLEGSPAEKAGLKRGDIIIEFDGKVVENVSQLQDIVAKTAPKKKVKIKVIRDRKEETIELVTGEMPEQIASGESKELKEKLEKEETAEWLGMKVSQLTMSLAQKYQIPEKESGVVVIEVDPVSKSSEIGIIEGDLIKSINRNETNDLESFKKITKKVKLSEGVVFDIIRQGRPVYISYYE
ncbi:MAG: Do family serine endopeptidase [Endomicrobiia bacterium]